MNCKLSKPSEQEGHPQNHSILNLKNKGHFFLFSTKFGSAFRIVVCKYCICQRFQKLRLKLTVLIGNLNSRFISIRYYIRITIAVYLERIRRYVFVRIHYARGYRKNLISQRFHQLYSVQSVSFFCKFNKLSLLLFVQGINFYNRFYKII